MRLNQALIIFMALSWSVFGVAAKKTDGPYLKGKNHYVVPKAYLDKSLSNLAPLLESARAVPERMGDRFLGFRIVSVEKSSDLRKLGILPGDVLLQFNEVKLDNAAKGLEAFQTIRTDKVIKLHVLRNKKNVVLTYERQQ